MEIVVYSLLVFGGVTFIAYPLLTRHAVHLSRPLAASTCYERLLAEKEEVYAAISDLDFEYSTGKLSTQDHAELREDYRVRALNILREYNELLDRAGAGSSANEHPPGRGALRCQACEYPNPAGSNFCESCGCLLGTTSVCPKCATAHAPDDRFCAICGNPLQLLRPERNG